MMDAARARALALELHDDQRDPSGALLIEHVGRVAAGVDPDARVVAWLHEVHEHTSISEQTLLSQGVSTVELRALRLIAHDNMARSDTSYLAHVALITRAAGAGAGLARSVKRADLSDRVEHPAVRPDGWTPPYAAGLALLERAARGAHGTVRLPRLAMQGGGAGR